MRSFPTDLEIAASARLTPLTDVAARMGTGAPWRSTPSRPGTPPNGALAARQLDRYERNGFGNLPVCIAKTHLSISSDPTLTGAPTDWRMPGLGTRPAAFGIDVADDGRVVGPS